MDTSVLDLVNNLGRVFLAVAVLVWGLYFRKMPKAMHFIGGYLALNLIIQLAANALYQQGQNNLPLLHVNTLLEFVCFSLFFREVYMDQHFFKTYFVPLIELGVALLILNSAFFEALTEFNTSGKAAVQLCLVGYVLLYFFDGFGRMDFSDRDTQAISFVCFAILLYYASSLFIFMTGQISVVYNLRKEFQLLWMLNSFFTTIFEFIVMGAIFRVAWWPRQTASLKHKHE